MKTGIGKVVKPSNHHHTAHVAATVVAQEVHSPRARRQKDSAMSKLAAALRTQACGDLRVQFVQKAFIVNDEHLLLVRKSESDPHHPRMWEVPGGRLKSGDDLESHVCREVREETGIEVEPGRPFHIWQWDMADTYPPAGSDARVRVVAVARECHPTTLTLSTEHWEAGDNLDDVRWVALNEVPDYNIIPDLKPAMETFLRIRSQGY